MNPDQELEAINPITETIIGCAIEVHRHLGPGLLEQTYEAAMCIELDRTGLTFARQPTFSINYKGVRIGEHRADLIVANAVVVELKSVDRFGLLINFNGRVLRTGARRFVL